MRISSIECTRVLAILAVMAIHISPFANPFDPTAWAAPHYVWLAGFINQITRFAVPFFFLTSGYFLQPHLQSVHPLRAAWHYCKPLLQLWVVWSLLYIVIPFSPWQVPAQGYLAVMQMQWGMLLSDPLNQWWVGGMVHLWFLPALILAVMVMGLAYHWQRPAWGLLLGGVLYLLALLGGSYAKPLLGAEWHLLTRNGPFFSLIFVALGVMLRHTNWRLSATQAWRLMLAGIALYAIEAVALFKLDGVPLNRHDFLLGSVPWAVGLFMLLLAKPHWGAGSWLERQAPKVLGIYCLHMLLVIWIFPLSIQWMSPLWEVVKLPVLWALAWAVWSLLSYLPGSMLLLRGRLASAR